MDEAAIAFRWPLLTAAIAALLALIPAAMCRCGCPGKTTAAEADHSRFPRAAVR